jgi:two-component system, chemotaxis family, protein-glutamate methylesterase/glutaminase
MPRVVPEQVRVLVAEDSTTARRMLVAVLERDPRIRVVGEAADGAVAVELAKRLRPSLILMDIHMPVLDGLEATKQLMRELPTPIIVVTAGTLPRDVEAGLSAVRHGALTVLPKPGGEHDAQFEASAQRLVTMVKALAEVKVIRRRTPELVRRAPSGPGANLVAVAASTGGPPALCALLQNLPVDLRVPVLVVQHIVKGFLPGLAAWLRAEVPFRVVEATEGERLEAGTVYLAPDDRHLEIDSRLRVRLTDGEAVCGFRPSATVMFRSIARALGPAAIGVVLTGMGEDGLDGMRELRRSGGRVLAQDAETSIVHGMPGAVVSAGLAHVVGPVERLAAEVASTVNGSTS